MSIDASALYVLAAPSTPEAVRLEALECAAQGETMTHAKVRAIASRYKESTKSKVCKSTISIPAEPPLTVQTVETQSAPVVEQFEDKLPEKKTEASAHFHLSDPSYDMVSATNTKLQSKIPGVDQAFEALEVEGEELMSINFSPPAPPLLPSLKATSYNSDDYPPKDSAEIEIESLFEIGHPVCITDFEQHDHKWFGKVAEVKESTTTDIEILIRISLQPQQVEE
ncbi:hypothetical protein [Scytonema sp. NUACC26]|uniref:hypothetical protein n=1 Tax=Scytonema sp. NUACC26 TaxID=3140176 RepID=UPI0034DB9FCE